jgi:HlyD family secretion protein
MKKRIILILIVLAAAGVAAVAAVYVFRGMGSDKSSRIVVSGNIELTEVNIAFKTAGRLIERTVDEGDAVKNGQVIARLDRDQLTAQREREVAGLESAQTQLAQSETSLEWEKATLAADIEQRRADLASNEARLAELPKRCTRTTTFPRRSSTNTATAGKARKRR